MSQTQCLIMTIVGILIVGAVSAYCEEPPGKRRPPGYIQQTTDPKQIEIETAYRMFWGQRLRDPFKEFKHASRRPAGPTAYAEERRQPDHSVRPHGDRFGVGSRIHRNSVCRP